MTAREVLVLNVVTVAGLFMLLEGASRFVMPTDFPDPVIANGHRDWSGTREYDPELFWRMRPNTTRLGQPLTNDQGLRGPALGPKDRSEFRILSLGESTTFASQLPYQECYSSVIERELRTVDGRHVRVVNAGAPAYSLFQGVVYLRREGRRLEPDAVMIYFGFNDFLRVAARVYRDAGASVTTNGMTDRELYEARRALRYRVTYWLQRRSNLVRWLTLRPSQDTGDSAEQVRQSDRPRVPEADRRALLEELREICRDAGIRLVVIIPWYRDFDEHVPLLRDMRPEPDGSLVVVDLPAVLPLPSTAYFRDRIHPNAAGHAEIGRAVTEALRSAWSDAGRPFSPAP